jgi:hypothetical protein
MAYVRRQRGTTQKLFLIETIIDDKPDERKYVVMGSTGNVYDVVIKTIPECTCPDYETRGNRCKHIYFILIKVMGVADVEQDEYSKEEIIDMFNNIPQITNNLIVESKFKETYLKLKNTDKPKEDTVSKKGTDDLCPICLDDLENGDETDYCKFSCGKLVHKVCYGMWIKKKAANCVFCNANWYGKKEESKYFNLTMAK